MDIIYEIQGRFRVTHIPAFRQHRESPRTIKRATPFLISFRPEGVAAAEHCELPNDLFVAIVGSEVPSTVRLMRRYLKDEYAMSDGMLEELLKMPQGLRRVALEQGEKDVRSENEAVSF